MWLRNGSALFNGHGPQSVVYGRYVDAVGALDRAGIASDTDPDTGILQGFLTLTQLYQADYLIGYKIHGMRKRTSIRAALTMPAQIRIYARATYHFSIKICVLAIQIYGCQR
jgi:hypothetical protein